MPYKYQHRQYKLLNPYWKSMCNFKFVDNHLFQSRNNVIEFPYSVVNDQHLSQTDDINNSTTTSVLHFNNIQVLCE